MEKELAVKMEKQYDLPDKTAEKYEILAYFKEQERAANRAINESIGSSVAKAPATKASSTQQRAASFVRGGLSGGRTDLFDRSFFCTPPVGLRCVPAFCSGCVARLKKMNGYG